MLYNVANIICVIDMERCFFSVSDPRLHLGQRLYPPHSGAWYKLYLRFPRRRKRQNLLPDLEIWCYMYQSWETGVCPMTAGDFTRLCSCYGSASASACKLLLHPLHSISLFWGEKLELWVAWPGPLAVWSDQVLIWYIYALPWRWWNGGNSEAGFWK